MSSNWCAGTGGVLVATRSDVLLLCQVALFRHDLEHAVAELLRDFIQVSALGPDHHTAVHHPTEVGQSRWAARRGGVKRVHSARGFGRADMLWVPAGNRRWEEGDENWDAHVDRVHRARWWLQCMQDLPES